MYTMLWRNAYLTLDAGSLPEMAARLQEASERLKEMSDAGVILLDGADDDAARLITDDADVAEKFGLDEDSAG